MTEQEQRIAIATACGWKWEPPANVIHPSKEKWWKPMPDHSDEIIREMIFDLPDFLHDLNAMHEAEQETFKMRYEIDAYHVELLRVCARDKHYDTPIYSFMATATQRAEAFLKCKGLWL